MTGARLEHYIRIEEDVIKVVCSIAIKAHELSGQQFYLSETICNSSQLVFSFPGSCSVTDWYSNSSFGEVKVIDKLFPSMKYIGLNETAKVNEAFLQRFIAVELDPRFKTEVEAAVADKKRVIFTGHSSGGAVAILAAIWFLEKYVRPDSNKTVHLPLCLSFGSPLVGDHIFSHSIKRENWSHCFINFVMVYDIVPRISFSPLSTIHHQLPQILSLSRTSQEPPGDVVVPFFLTVLRNASSVASHRACKIMGSTNLLLETVSNFIELSPYRPLGTFVFCTGSGRLVVVKNSDAILQLLFYTSQLNSEEELFAVAKSSISSHLYYQTELLESLEMQSVTFLDDHDLEALPLSSDNIDADCNAALNELGLSARARLCLRATGNLEKQKRNNQTAIDQKMGEIENELRKLQGYQRRCQHKVGYYDAFKISEDKEDFDANVTRLKLAGIWDEIIEMLKRFQLPDEFEGRKAWIEIGTRYRRIVEPLDIANYYRHLKNEDTGPYMEVGRPKRYKCTQRWLEHAKRTTAFESCFWAEVEELCCKSGSFSVREDASRLKIKAEEWIRNGCLDKEVFLKGSTFDRLLKEHSLTLEQPDAYKDMWN